MSGMKTTSVSLGELGNNELPIAIPCITQPPMPDITVLFVEVSAHVTFGLHAVNSCTGLAGHDARRP